MDNPFLNPQIIDWSFRRGGSEYFTNNVENVYNNYTSTLITIKFHPREVTYEESIVLAPFRLIRISNELNLIPDIISMFSSIERQTYDINLNPSIKESIKYPKLISRKYVNKTNIEYEKFLNVNRIFSERNYDLTINPTLNVDVVSNRIVLFNGVKYKDIKKDYEKAYEKLLEISEENDKNNINNMFTSYNYLQIQIMIFYTKCLDLDKNEKFKLDIKNYLESKCISLFNINIGNSRDKDNCKSGLKYILNKNNDPWCHKLLNDTPFQLHNYRNILHIDLFWKEVEKLSNRMKPPLKIKYINILIEIEKYKTILFEKIEDKKLNINIFGINKPLSDKFETIKNDYPLYSEFYYLNKILKWMEDQKYLLTTNKSMVHPYLVKKLFNSKHTWVPVGEFTETCKLAEYMFYNGGGYYQDSEYNRSKIINFIQNLLKPEIIHLHFHTIIIDLSFIECSDCILHLTSKNGIKLLDLNDKYPCFKYIPELNRNSFKKWIDGEIVDGWWCRLMNHIKFMKHDKLNNIGINLHKLLYNALIQKSDQKLMLSCGDPNITKCIYYPIIYLCKIYTKIISDVTVESIQKYEGDSVFNIGYFTMPVLSKIPGNKFGKNFNITNNTCTWLGVEKENFTMKREIPVENENILIPFYNKIPSTRPIIEYEKYRIEYISASESCKRDILKEFYRISHVQRMYDLSVNKKELDSYINEYIKNPMKTLDCYFADDIKQTINIPNNDNLNLLKIKGTCNFSHPTIGMEEILDPELPFILALMMKYTLGDLIEEIKLEDINSNKYYDTVYRERLERNLIYMDIHPEKL